MSQTIMQRNYLTRLAHLAASAMPQLTSPRVNPDLTPQLPTLLADARAALPASIAPQTLLCLEAGLHILADDLDRAHTLCQDVPGPLGSAWHAIVHRREPDFWNANYWWRRASALSWSLPDGPLTTALHTLCTNAPDPRARAWAAKFSTPTYDPTQLVALVEHHHRDPQLTLTIAELQRTEWLSLMHLTLTT